MAYKRVLLGMGEEQGSGVTDKCVNNPEMILSINHDY